LTSITIPKSIKNIARDAFQGCTNLTNVYIEDIGAWCSINGLDNIFSYSRSGGHLHLNNQLVTDLIIPDGVTTINSYAFCNFDHLTSVTISDSVTSVGEGAFYRCDNLISVTIGKGVTKINNRAFDSCYYLAEVINKSSHITVEKGSSRNGSVGNYAAAIFNSGDTYINKFTNDKGYIVCTDGEEKILVRYEGTESALTLPDYITQINFSVFHNNDSLTSVVLSNNVKRIALYAFDTCNNLESVYYKGTETDWNKINFDSYNESLINATRYYYSENEPTDNGNYWYYKDGAIVVWKKEN
jgi:hypothetical protein